MELLKVYCYHYESYRSILIRKMYSNRPKLSQPESQHLLKDFCVAFTGTMDKLQITLEQAAMYVHMSDS